MSGVTFKRIQGEYISNNGWTISHDNDWAGLWSVHRTKAPPIGYKWKVKSFQTFKQAKEWVETQ